MRLVMLLERVLHAKTRPVECMHCNKERVEITHERVLIECPGIQHAVHMCCLVYVLSLHACSLLVSQNSTVSTLC